MKSLKLLSIREKLNYIIFGASLLSLCIGFLVVIVSGIRQEKRDMVSDNIMHANIIGEYLVSPLVFQDIAVAKDVLSKVQNIPSIQYGAVFNSKGESFAAFGLKEKTGVPVLPGNWEATEFKGDHLHVFQPIFYQGERYGAIYLRVSTSELDKKIRNYLLLLSLLMIGLIMFSYFLADRLQRIVSRPILKLAGITREIKKRADYSLRVQKEGDDEIGELYDGFNEMLRQIQKRELERNKAKKALVKTKEQYRMLVEQSGQMMYDYDIPTGKINWSGDIQTVTGYLPEEFQKIDIDKWEKHIHNDDRKVALGRLEESMQKSSNYNVEYRFKRKNGTYFYVEDSGLFLGDDKDKVYRMLGIMKDISERKQAEERIKRYTKELERSNKDLEQFAYVASHDLQEPLRMISSYTQLLERRYKDKLDKNANDFIEFTVDGANRMQKLINDLLLYSRVTTRGKPFKEVDSYSILGQVINNLQQSIKEMGAIVTNDDLPTIRADKSQIVRVFQNLIDNAIKFHSEETPRINISAQEKANEWVFSVSDNGIGIDKRFRERIFTIFQRLHQREEYPGTGIGLAICKRVVQRHGGKIWFESQPGKGAIFYFTLSKKIESQSFYD